MTTVQRSPRTMKALSHGDAVDASKLKIGDVLHNDSALLEGKIEAVSPRGAYVEIKWTTAKRRDILSRTSPLWHLLKVERG